jgi:hypothetical protein
MLTRRGAWTHDVSRKPERVSSAARGICRKALVAMPSPPSRIRVWAYIEAAVAVCTGAVHDSAMRPVRWRSRCTQVPARPATFKAHFKHIRLHNLCGRERQVRSAIFEVKRPGSGDSPQPLCTGLPAFRADPPQTYPQAVLQKPSPIPSVGCGPGGSHLTSTGTHVGGSCSADGEAAGCCGIQSLARTRLRAFGHHGLTSHAQHPGGIRICR